MASGSYKEQLYTSVVQDLFPERHDQAEEGRGRGVRMRESRVAVASQLGMG